MNKKMKTGIIATVLSVIMITGVSAHTYTALYSDENGNVTGVVTADGNPNIGISVNGSQIAIFVFKCMDKDGNYMYQNGGDLISISSDIQTLIGGNIFNGQAFVFKLISVKQVN
jgi:hypothetical protein